MGIGPESPLNWHSLFRPATTSWPTTPEEWNLRPYFINDYDISWLDLRRYLSSQDEYERAWAWPCRCRTAATPHRRQ